MAGSWWATTIVEALSQGDIVEGICFNAPFSPQVRLGTREEHNGRYWWCEDAEAPLDANQRFRCIAYGFDSAALVVSHSCEIDKPTTKPSKKRVLAAPVSRLAILNDDEQRELVLARQSAAMCPLPGVPGLGDCYADFRRIMPVPAQALQAGRRLASMEELALRTLQNHLMLFFLREGE